MHYGNKGRGFGVWEILDESTFGMALHKFVI